MNGPRIARRVGALAIMLGGVMPALPAAAQTAPPTNDDFAAAPLAALPLSATTDLRGATLEPGEPGSCAFTTGSEWYRIETPTTQVLRVAIQGPVFQVWADVYRDTGSGLAGLVPVTSCISPFSSPALSTAAAGGTYYVRISGNENPPFPPARLTVEAVPPPNNDNVAEATSIEALPFSDSADTTAATLEPGESMPCAFSPPERTVWYRYSPPVDTSVTFTASGSFASGAVAVYAGSADPSSMLGCRAFGPLTVRALAGATYLLQAAPSPFGSGGPLQVTLDVAPPPNAGFFFSPPDPASREPIQFFSQSTDPGGMAFSERWDFGDGIVVDGTSPRHGYTTDGDYSVTVRVTTEDGRTASATQDVHVRTYDVTITKLQVPNNAHAGQTRAITVSVANDHYPVPVEVLFTRSSRGGDVPIGSVTQTIPAQGSNKTTDVSITYTFTAEDAAAGKVTFRAVVATPAHRDVYPGDNTAISFPTRVER